jgi:hypothetical protein
MGFKSMVIALAITWCVFMTAFAQGPKNQIVETAFPTDTMSGSEIENEVGSGVYTENNDSSLSFRNESLFIIRKDTGMSASATDKGVRTPVKVIKSAASVQGAWSLTMKDIITRYLKLNLNQNGDAVYGSGELINNGVTTQVTAGGTVLGDQMALFVTSAGSQDLYRLSLTITPGSMNGDYIYTALGINQPGVAFGSLIAPQEGSTTGQAMQTAATNQIAGNLSPTN